MKIGFYFDASHLKDFSILKFNEDQLGISGTDSSFFRVVSGLSKCDGIDLYLFAKNIKEFPGLTFKIVSGIEEAIVSAKETNIEIFVFNLKKREDTISAIKVGEELKLHLIPWAQNPIENTLLEELTNSAAILKIVYVEQFDLSHTRHKKGFYKGVVIPNGIEKEVYTKRPISLPGNLNVSYLGSLTPSKGFHHIAKAWKQVLEAVPDARLLVIGSGQLYNNHAKLGPLGIADEKYESELAPFIGYNTEELEKNNIECYGLLNRNEIIEVINKTRVACINPNIYGSLESCSVSSLEVQLCGVPVVAGKAGGNLNTIIHRKTGMLIRDHNGELPETIIRLLKDDNLNLQMREAARNYILNKYEIQLVINHWIDFFHKLTNGYAFPIARISPELAEGRLYAKEAIRVIKKIIKW